MGLNEDDWDEFFEDDNTRELKQIFQGQSAMNEVLRDLHRKMDEIIGRQERSLSVLTIIQNTGARSGGAPPAQGGAAGDTQMQQTINEIRDGLNRVKMDMQNGYARQGQQKGQPTPCPEVAC